LGGGKGFSRCPKEGLKRTIGTDNTDGSQQNLDQSNNKGEGAATEAGNMEVDLKGFTPGVRPK